MSKRKRLIWKTLAFTALPLAVLVALVVFRQSAPEDPYVAGRETEGITRDLERTLEEGVTNLSFTEVTAQAGIDFDHFPLTRTSQLPEDMGSGAAWGDYDADGWPDLFLTNFAAPLHFTHAEMEATGNTDRLYRNLGDGAFEDVTAQAGIDRIHRGMGAAWGDFDGDGHLDLVVTAYGHNVLWRSQGDGTFRDVTAQAGIRGEGFWAGPSWSDYDGDGDLDLYICGYVQYVPEAPGSAATQRGEAEYPFTLNPSSYPPHVNQLYVNQGDGSFQEQATEAGVLGELGRSLSASWCDFDEDGRPDLYVTNDVSDNVMYRNLGDGTFQNISYEALVADYRGSMGIAIGDWDGDLDLDMFITHWLAQENALYSNVSSEGATGKSRELFFGDDADRIGLGQIALDLIGWGTAFSDFDNDGWLDLAVVNGSTFQDRDNPRKLIPMDPHLYWNRGAAEGFYEVGREAGICTNPPGGGRGLALADYDLDGDQDLCILRHGSKARLLRNDSRSRGASITFRLKGSAGHASGLGARLVAYAHGRGQLREAGAGSSYLSQHGSDIHVGLGSATQVDSVLVAWPGGRRDVWHNLQSGRVWELTEGGPANAIRNHGGEPAGAGRRTSKLSHLAVVTDVSSELTTEDKLRFWKLNEEAGALFTEGRWQEAVGVFEAMLEIDPSHEDAVYYCGNSLLELGRFERAKACWERLLEINPMSSRAWMQIGLLHTLPEGEALFDLPAAMRAFQHAHDINREESRPLAMWGEAALAAGDAESARTILAQAYGMNAQSTSALFLSGYLAWRDGDQDRASELLERAVRSIPAPEPVHGVLGEGDIRSQRMGEYRRQAAARRLFADSLVLLRGAGSEVDPKEAYSWVEADLRALAELRDSGK